MPAEADNATISILLGLYSQMKCDLLEDAFNRRSGFKVVGRASTAADLVTSTAHCHPDVALVSARLQDGVLNGFLALRQMRESNPSLKSIMLLDSSDPQLVIDSFRAGAKGIFCPEQNHFELHGGREAAHIAIALLNARDMARGDGPQSESRSVEVRYGEGQGNAGSNGRTGLHHQKDPAHADVARESRASLGNSAVHLPPRNGGAMDGIPDG